MNIAIVGGSLAGSYTAYLLAQKGFTVKLFDHKIPYEKPCGGGISFKTYKEFPVLQNGLINKHVVSNVKIKSHNDFNWDMDLNHPVHIVSRKDLSQALLKLAVTEGTDFIQEKVYNVYNKNDKYIIETKTSTFEFDYIIGADGARSLVRRIIRGPLPKKDYSITLGYYMPIKDFNQIILKFHEKLKGYIWIFPRQDHLSIGIGALYNNIKPGELKSILDQFVTEEIKDIDLSKGQYYSAYIPCIPEEDYDSLECCGENWALVGDAAGFADPITGEGIYYALKSAELLSNAIIKNSPLEYDAMWKSEFGAELKQSSKLSRYFYNHDFMESIVMIASKSKTIQSIISDLMTGQQSYISLKERLLSNLGACIKDAIFKYDMKLNKRLYENIKYIKNNW